MFKIGDKVRITSVKPEDYDKNLGPGWSASMSDCLGKIGVVAYIHKDGVARVYVDDYNNWVWRPRDLTKIEENVVSEQSIPGVPSGYRLVRIGNLKPGDWYIDNDGFARLWECSDESMLIYPILEKFITPLELKVGHWYQRRDGLITKVIAEIDKSSALYTHGEWRFETIDDYVRADGMSVELDGYSTDEDLIREVKVEGAE